MKSFAIRAVLMSAGVLGTLGTFGGGAAYAAYPDKPVKYIIPFAPGGESDIAGRFQQLVFRKKFNQELIIESKPGAGGALAWSQTNSFAGDGYTWMSTNLPHLVLQPMEGQVQYKTEDIHNVCFYHYTPDAIVVRSESPFKTYQELVKAAKDMPDTITIAGSGTNSANHVATERFNGAAGVKTTYVPFKGTGDLVASLLGGHVSMAMSYVTLAIAQKSKTRMLAIATETRHPQFPDVRVVEYPPDDLVVESLLAVAVAVRHHEVKQPGLLGIGFKELGHVTPATGLAGEIGDERRVVDARGLDPGEDRLARAEVLLFR